MNKSAPLQLQIRFEVCESSGSGPGIRHWDDFLIQLKPQHFIVFYIIRAQSGRMMFQGNFELRIVYFART